MFLRGRRPHLPLNPHAVTQMIRSRLERLGVQGMPRGPHTLCHAFAARLLRGGQPLKSIADLLGHRSLSATAIYAKVDHPQLFKVAVEWPKVARQGVRTRVRAPQRYTPNMREVFALAEYFPGGGTDFQTPLNAALECLRQATHKRGDIVFITDGECRVDADWLSDFRREKEKLGFSLFSVLIDVGSSSLGALKEFSDQITSVGQLSSDATRDIFLKL